MPRKPEDNSPRGNAIRANIAAQQREHRRRNRGAVDAADWKEASYEKIAKAIVAVTQHGYAIRFGYTKDGGAFAIGILGDGEPFTEFVRPTEDIDLFLDGLVIDYGDEDAGK